MKIKELCSSILKPSKKAIQVALFILLVIAFTLNHYKINITKPCEEWGKQTNLIMKALGRNEEVNVCTKHSFIPNGISLVAKSRQASRIPADLILLFIGAGILYFTKDFRVNKVS